MSASKPSSTRLRPPRLCRRAVRNCPLEEDADAQNSWTTNATSSRDDVAFVVQEFWASASSSSGQLRTALRQSRGGRNLVELGFDADIELAARVDSVQVVAEYFATEGRIEPVR